MDYLLTIINRTSPNEFDKVTANSFGEACDIAREKRYRKGQREHFSKEKNQQIYNENFNEICCVVG